MRKSISFSVPILPFQILLLILKLNDIIQWPWWVVWLPMIVGFIWGCLIVINYTVVFFALLYFDWYMKKKTKRIVRVTFHEDD